MARRRRAISPKGKHGRGGKQNGGVDKGWEGDEKRWDSEFLAAFQKERERIPEAEETSEAELRKIAMLVAAKAKGFRIRADKAGKLAAKLCEDFHMLRVQLMTDLINNPNILESIKRVRRGEGDERQAGLIDEEAVEEADREEAAEAKGEATDA